jgi:zinc and cadmium transporter
MSVLAWILVTSLAGGALSVLAAAVFALSARGAWVPHLISYAIGALLGAAFLEVLPNAIEAHGEAGTATTIVLAGILGFFVLENWCCGGTATTTIARGTRPQQPAQDHGRSGLLILVGDTFHNFVDGVLIAAAFMQDVRLGLSPRWPSSPTRSRRKSATS